MIGVEVVGESSAMQGIALHLDRMDGVSRVRIVDAARAGHSLVIAVAQPATVDSLLDDLRDGGISDSDIALTRVEVIGSTAAVAEDDSLVWADVLGSARLNARLISRYLTFMVVAGAISCYGVIDENIILIVGAMAVSPDLLPITAIAVGLVGRRKLLAGRALGTVVLGLAITGASAAVITALQDRLDLLPSSFTLQSASAALGGLTTVSDETIIVALAAGVAGMLALETRASSGVGVAISVTTVPAAAYLGVAAGVGEFGDAAGAARVLAVNVAMMVIGALTTLVIQRRLLGRHHDGTAMTS